jgi:uncharacterized MAPEG superfamily protein
VAAVFAGILGEQRAGAGELGLNGFVIGWNVIRVLYTANYLTAETMKWSYLRSALYFAGLAWAFAILYRAAVVLA